MKDLNTKLASLMLGLSLITTSAMASKWSDTTTPTTSSSTKSLSEVEQEDLLFMREEEKLARDVYLFAFSQWGDIVFSNIAESEEEHTEQILALIEKYKLEDPALEAEGEFTNTDLQELYNNLIAEVQNSEIDALYVGALIEEKDMIDILDAIERTDNRDIKTVYENLMEGSKSHLQGFVDALASQGITYEPKLIDEDLYEDIIDEDED